MRDTVLRNSSLCFRLMWPFSSTAVSLKISLGNRPLHTPFLDKHPFLSCIRFLDLSLFFEPLQSFLASASSMSTTDSRQLFFEVHTGGAFALAFWYCAQRRWCFRKNLSGWHILCTARDVSVHIRAYSGSNIINRAVYEVALQVFCLLFAAGKVRFEPIKGDEDAGTFAFPA